MEDFVIIVSAYFFALFLSRKRGRCTESDPVPKDRTWLAVLASSCHLQEPQNPPNTPGWNVPPGSSQGKELLPPAEPQGQAPPDDAVSSQQTRMREPWVARLSTGH